MVVGSFQSMLTFFILLFLCIPVFGILNYLINLQLFEEAKEKNSGKIPKDLPEGEAIETPFLFK